MTEPELGTSNRLGLRASGANLVLQWRTLGIAGLLIGICAVAALAVVATLENASALSTVALALAILAFVIQIIVFVVQAWTSSQQMLQSESLNAETRNLLTEVRTAAAGQQTVLAQQFDRVLNAALEHEVPEAIEEATAESPGDPEQVERALREGFSRIADEVKETFRHELAATLTKPIAPTPTPVPGVTEADALAVVLLDTYPTEQEGRQSLLILNELSPPAFNALRQLAQRERQMRQRGQRGALPLPEPRAQELLEKGLVEQADTNRYVLSDTGFRVARLLRARPPRPEYMKELLPPGDPSRPRPQA